MSSSCWSSTRAAAAKRRAGLRGADSHVQGGSDSLWALEQALKSGHVGAVLAWLPPRLRAERLRRLQLAAHAHDGPAFVLREWPARERPTAAPLRLALRRGGADRLAVRLLKRRGPPLARRCSSRCRRCCRRRRGGVRLRARVAGAAVQPQATTRLIRRRCRWTASPCCGSPCICRCCRWSPSRRRLPPAAASDDAIALLDAHAITSANAAAQQLGVKPGLKRATALALAPQLRLGQADAARDAQALASVAHAALAFTPAVTLPPQEAADRASTPCCWKCKPACATSAGSTSCCSGCRAALAPLGHRVCIASAPTAQGAALLARCVSLQAGTSLCTAPTSARCGSRLDDAPVWLLGPGREHWEALQGMGLRTLSDLRRLPRSGLARRFGEALLDELDRALGERPDPRAWIMLPPVFESRLELFARADTTEQVLHGAARAAGATGRLGAGTACARAPLHAGHAARARGTRQHEAPAQTLLEIALAEPSRDVEHLLRAAARAPGATRSCPRRRSSCACAAATSRAARRPTASCFPPRKASAKGWCV